DSLCHATQIYKIEEKAAGDSGERRLFAVHGFTVSLDEDGPKVLVRRDIIVEFFPRGGVLLETGFQLAPHRQPFDIPTSQQRIVDGAEYGFVDSLGSNLFGRDDMRVFADLQHLAEIVVSPA